ncbi:MAG TPA: response regulator [Patescibacteria group bacterium]|nr:response regulator [Patescibacteria group bacterium]
MKKIKILIVEDDKQISNIYKFKLEKYGYDVDLAFNGQEGLTHAENYMPDIILLDLLMPVISGEEMLKQMRKFPWGASIKVIILTNISKDEAPSSLGLLGVDRYIVKAHYTPTQVLDIIEEVMQHTGHKKS